MSVAVDPECETIGEHLVRCGVSRRDILEFCAKLMAAAPFGLALTSEARAAQVARSIAQVRRPSVIWLHFQDCTGCSETFDPCMACACHTLDVSGRRIATVKVL